MNDPNGLIQWQDTYHMFYQYNPHGAFHGTIHWGHAESKDLVHWEHRPVALAPTPGGPDADGCWSGCTINNNGTPTFVYSGFQKNLAYQVPCLATGSADLLEWEKHPQNPVISTPPADLDIRIFRDHCVWRENGIWYQLISGDIHAVGGAVFLYQSTDLIHWDYLHPLLVGDRDQMEPFWTGTTWECPDLFPLGDKHVLVLSLRDMDSDVGLYTAYFMGTYADHKFTPETLKLFDYGDVCFYAPQTFLDKQSRRVMFGWIAEGRSNTAQLEAGWSGVMSLPRVLTPRDDGKVGVAPAAELEILRGDHHQLAQVPLTPASTRLPDEIQGDCLEIIAEFEVDPTSPAQAFGLKVRCSPDEEEYTLIVYDHDTKRLEIIREKSTLTAEIDNEAQGGPFELDSGTTLRLHIFLDRSVVEIFANGWSCLTSRIYPTRPDSLAIKPYVKGGHVLLKSLEVWQMNPIWPTG
jgi:beta-fructofuranosidase